MGSQEGSSYAIRIFCLYVRKYWKVDNDDSAAVPRAFVSTGGSDSNPCSAVQPCRSFNQALTVVQAGGEIVVQNSAGIARY